MSRESDGTVVSFDNPAQLHCPQQAIDIFTRLDAAECLQTLTRTYHAAACLDEPVKECIHFEFLKKEKLAELFDRDPAFSAKYFWTQLAQLLAFVARTAPRAVSRLIDGIMVAVSAKNELLLALAIRAWQEQVSALFVVTEEIKTSRDRLIEAWKTIDRGGPTPMGPDKKLRGHLVGYSLGRRINSLSLSPPHLRDGTKREWEDFNSAMKVDKSDELLANNVLNSIDKVGQLKHTYFWRSVYEDLCEYCHPNSSSRSMDFAPQVGSTGNYSFSVRDAELSIAFRRVFNFGKLIVPDGCALLEDSFACVASSLCPLPMIEDSWRTPTVNSLAVVDDFGRKIFVPRDAISGDSPLKPAVLTDEQIIRIRRLANMVGDTDETHFEDWVKDISRDLDPEAELQIHEACAEAFKEELEMRSGLGKEARKLLWIAVIQSTLHESLANLLSAQPQLKGLSKLDRVFRRIKKRQLKSGSSNV